MKNIVLRLLIFGVLAVVVTMALALLIEKIYYPNVSEQVDKVYPQSNLFYVGENQNYNCLVLGSSRGLGIKRPFIEGLGEETLNCGIPGGGVRIQQSFLQYFYNQNNSTKQILYFIDPFAIQTDKWDYTWYLLRHEPFRLGFAIELLKRVNLKMLGIYMASKIQAKGFTYFHGYQPEAEVKLSERDTAAVQNVIDGLYSAADEVVTAKQMAVITKTIEIANRNNSKVIFCIAPTLLGNEPFQEQLTAFLTELKETHQVEFYDYHNLYNQPKYYPFFRDYSHMNTNGLNYFFKEQLANKL